MATLKAEIEQFALNRSESELRIAIGELVKKVFSKNGVSKAVPIHDADDRKVGLLVTEDTLQNPDLSDYATFLAVTRYRIANPPERFLTPEEFLANLTPQ
jgi:hypothetical protein